MRAELELCCSLCARCREKIDGLDETEDVNNELGAERTYCADDTEAEELKLGPS